MTLPTLTPAAARRLLDDGAVLVDIREPDEFRREHIAGARNQPANKALPRLGEAKAVIFHCRSGARTAANAPKLAAASACDAYILEGGLEA